MLTAEQLKLLKRVDISADADKTKQRTEEVWKPAKIKQKQEIREAADFASQTIYRVFATGSITAKTTIAIAQGLNVNPFYLTGEVDEPGEFTDAALHELLLKLGYSELVASLEPLPKAKRPYNRRSKPDEAVAPPEAEPETEEAPAEEPEVDVEPPVPPAPVFSLEEADQQAMLRALHIQCKAGISGAKERLAQINQLLLS